MKAAISIQQIWKRYQLGQAGSSGGSFREILASAVTAPARRFRRLAGSAEDEAFWALQGVSFDVAAGEVVGVIGRNGAGKSTLLKILSRITEPTRGRIELRGRVASLLEVGTGFHPDLSGRENIYLNGAILGMSRAEIRRKFDAIVDFAEVAPFLDTAVKHYSSGMYLRLAFGVAAHLDGEILLVDEVLAVGDAAFQQKCLGKMQDVSRGGRTVLFISHNMAAVSALCNRAMVLEGGRARFDGPVVDAVEYYNHSLFGERVIGSAGHVLYEAGASGHAADCAVTRIEMLDTSGAPKTFVSTGDGVVFRIHVVSRRPVKRGSVCFDVSTFGGLKLWTLSTQPDGTLPIEFVPGIQAVDCVIPWLPLAAGEYTIGAAVAIPYAEYLWRGQELARLSVLPGDVYGSGLAPTAGRSAVAVGHEWRRVPITSTLPVPSDRCTL